MWHVAVSMNNHSVCACLPDSAGVLSFSVLGKSSTTLKSWLKFVSMRLSDCGFCCVFDALFGLSDFIESPLHSSDTHDATSPPSPFDSFSTSFTGSVPSVQLELELEVEVEPTLTIGLGDGGEFVFFTQFVISLFSPVSRFKTIVGEQLVLRGSLL